jgi:hypothetical protein
MRGNEVFDAALAYMVGKFPKPAVDLEDEKRRREITQAFIDGAVFATAHDWTPLPETGRLKAVIGAAPVMLFDEVSESTAWFSTERDIRAEMDEDHIPFTHFRHQEPPF